jgi:transcriptional regulator with XRE-family HTH domain
MNARTISPAGLLSIREELGMTQREFAAHLMVCRHYVSLLECGKRGISPRMSVKIRELSMRLHCFPANPTRDEARRIFENTMRLAADNQGRLNWMLSKLRKHLEPPTNWLPTEKPQLSVVSLRGKKRNRILGF